MPTRTNTNVERIIAKIDNDFNPDNSDWIPRVGAWTIDVLNMLDVNTTKKVRRKIPVKNRIARTITCLKNKEFKVIGQCGKELEEYIKEEDYTKNSSTGKLKKSDISHTTSIVENNVRNFKTIQHTIQTKDYNHRYNVVETIYDNSEKPQKYCLVDNDKIELLYDCDYIIVESNEPETEFSDIYQCELPVVPNNGKLIEAIVYYCMYKMLCRGYKHQVFNLSASQYGTNPYYIWTQLKDEAKRSVLNQGFDDGDVWKNVFFNFTFDPKN